MVDSFVVCGDIHLNDSAPGIRKDDYPETIFSKLDQVREYADEKHIITLGDVFHTHSLSMEFIGRCIDFFNETDHHWYSVAGNHDPPYGKAEYLDRSPLSILFKSGAIKDLTKEAPPIDGIDVVAKHFTKNPDFDISQSNNQTILFAHQHIEEQWGDNSEVIDENILQSVDLSFLGHDHAHKVKTFNNGSTCILPGSISRLTSHWKDLQKDVYVYIVDVHDGLSWERKALDIPEIEVAYDVNELEEKERKKELDSFIDSLETRDVSTQAHSIGGLLKELSSTQNEEMVCEDYLRRYGLL